MIKIGILVTFFVVVFSALLFALVRYASKKEAEIREHGILVKSSVCEVHSKLDDGHRRYQCYVSYIDETGTERKAHLNVSCKLPIGRVVHIKYLPGQYDQAIFVSQEL